MNVNNPWGVSLEAQRSDLWVADLSRVVDIVTNPAGVSPTAEYNALKAVVTNASDLNRFEQRITLPEETISALELISDSQKANTPGMDEPVSPVRIDFIHEVVGETASKSAIYSLLACWQYLAMAGQSYFFRSVLPLASAASKPVFMADVPLTLLSGSEDGTQLEEASSYVLRNCWISDLQLPNMDYNDASTAIITATLQLGRLQPTR